MARVEREPNNRRPTTPPHYDIRDRLQYELNRFMRRVKYITVGGAIGFGIGITLGIPWAVRLTEQIAHPAPLAVATSLSLDVMVLGVVTGYIAGELTAPSLPGS